MTKDKKTSSTSASQQDDTMDTSAVNNGENGAAHETEGPAYEEKFKFMNAMASPVAPKKLAKKLFKCVKQATKQKNYIRLGLRETQKYIRRGEKGIVILAGNVTPIDIYSHMPVVCGEFALSRSPLFWTFFFFRGSKHSIRLRSIQGRSRKYHPC